MRESFCIIPIMIHLDPYRQSFIYFKWGFWSVFILGGLLIWGCTHIESPLFKILLDNVFVYLPNYLTHEFSHRFWAILGWKWWNVCFRQRYGNADSAYFMFLGLTFKGRAAVAACFALLAGYYFVWGGNLLRRCTRDEIASYIFRYGYKLCPRCRKGGLGVYLGAAGLIKL